MQVAAQGKFNLNRTSYWTGMGLLTFCFIVGFLAAVGQTFADDLSDIQSASQQNQDAAALTITAKPGVQLPLNAIFTDSEGRQVHLGDYFHKGRPVILDFIFSAALVCVHTCSR